MGLPVTGQACWKHLVKIPLISLGEKKQVDKSKDEIMKSEQERQMRFFFSSFSTQKKSSQACCSFPLGNRLSD